MVGPLLETKLHAPRLRRTVVPRPRLAGRLSRDAALTLVSAPAGFGKTTLLAQWVAAAVAEGWGTAWVSLDPHDDDPAVFWRYVAAALREATPDAALRGAAPDAGAARRAPGGPAPAEAREGGATAFGALEGGSPTEAELTAFVNDLHAGTGAVVLVLDDYHVISAREIHDGVAFLVEHLPDRVHLVIAGRADPPLPLARLRARGDLVEVRAADLRFAREETAQYLTGRMGLDLTDQQVTTLGERTEGWVVALQLAALSVQGRDDVAGFIAGFGGDDRYVVDYLLEEVLQQQGETVRAFLLRTSILTRLEGSLCDAVTGQGDGAATLAALERVNLFLVPLDDRRRWYRYHHLFADVLHARLLAEEPGEVAGLHRRASEWFAAQGDGREAIRHALAAGDGARAADLLEVEQIAMRQDRQEATLRRLLEALPEAQLRSRPQLALTHAGVLLQHGEIDGVEARLRDAEAWVRERVADGDGDALMTSVRGQIAVYRSAQAQQRGDLAGAAAHARRVLDLVGEDAALERGAAAGLLGLVGWAAGDLEDAHRSWSEAVTNLERAGHYSDTLGCTIALADIRLSQGRLGDAVASYERGLAVANRGERPLRGAADMHVGLAGLLLERGELDAARRHLRAGEELGEEGALPQNRHRALVVGARLRAAEGDLAGALGLLDDAARAYTPDMFPDVRPIHAWRARVLIEQGDLAEARRWAREHGLSADDELAYLREHEHLTLARLLLADHAATGDGHALEEAAGLLDRLLVAAQERGGGVVEVLVLRARAHLAAGSTPASDGRDAGGAATTDASAVGGASAGDGPAAALSALRRAVDAAEPEGYVRVFADEGRPIVALLRVLEKEGTALPYVRRLLVAATHEPAPATQRELPAPLSERELEVLRLLGGELSGPDIARELIVSLNTVRTHTKNIYDKLGVNSRRAAVRRAGELGLLRRTGTGGSDAPGA